MGIDAFVMPLWRFKVGDFETPVEQLAGGPDRASYVSAGGVWQRASVRGFFARRRARKEVAAIVRAVEARNGHQISWRDDGTVARCEQFRTREPMRAYLYWLDRRDLIPAFEPPAGGDYSTHHFFQIARDRPPTMFPHLNRNGVYNDYMLPCDFEHPVEVEPYLILDTLRRVVSSSIRALHELQQMNDELQVNDDFEWSDADPLSDVKIAYLQL